MNNMYIANSAALAAIAVSIVAGLCIIVMETSPFAIPVAIIAIVSAWVPATTVIVTSCYRKS